MADVLTPEQRRRNMQRIRSKNTQPEMAVRRLIWALGYRYRLHRRDLPGSPDLVFPGKKKVVFVHGCFWHCHSCRFGRVLPKTRAQFWRKKRDANVRRDEETVAKLTLLGWGVLTVWECQVKEGAAAAVIESFLSPGR